ncbi:MAG: hypothetical protein QFC55_06930, partial [Chloroflexota bacterium]|nr:hypothetical protein [Chloroflexota bacterium]
RDLLPAVRHEIDARPQRVMTSNWSPRLGVAAVVAALLILVIAVPRLAPQPPSATPTPPLGLVMSTADFGVRLASGGLDEQTVLVDGGIVAYDGPPKFGPFCGAGGPACPIGQLEGISPRVVVSSPDIAVASSDDSTVQVSPGWPWWARLTPPVHGTLLLSVGDVGDVEYIGRVKLDGGQLIWSVADAAAQDVNSLARDEVALVNGWLGTKYRPGTVFDCAPPYPDLVGLPSRYCVNTGLLSTKRPDDLGGPGDADHLQVQEAAIQFAAAPQDQAAVYAISPRLYGGGCGGAQPCWLWDVVAKVETPPSDLHSPSPPPVPGPETVLSTSEFADGVASGQLIGRVVLVQGKISVPSTPEPADYPCNPPDGLCGLGALEGTDPLIYVDANYMATTDSSGSGTWAGSNGGRDYHFPTVPIEGVLALRALSGSHAQFIGLEKQNGEQAVWSVSEAQGLVVDAMRRDEIVLVSGWLGGFTNVRCLADIFVKIDALPIRQCSDELVSRDPDPEPGSPVIMVQPGANRTFAPDPTMRDNESWTPRHGVYALAPRLEGWCRNANPPCWQWNVVARIDGAPTRPIPTSTEAPTATPAPSPSTAVITCSGGVAGAASLRDNTGNVVSCASQLGSEALTQNVTVSNPGGDAQDLRIDLRVSSCDIRALSLEFWEPPVGHALGEQSRPTHALQIDRSETEVSCVDGVTDITSQTIQLVLNTPIDATNVNAFVTTGPGGSNTIETHGNTFALTLTAGSDTYTAGSPMDVFATRGYLGPEKTTVSGYGMWFGFKQLDGTLELWPAATRGGLSCATQELQQGDSDTSGYSKSGSWSNDDPNAAFYNEYIRDPLLHLPVGTYRLFAVLLFTNGGCGGEQVKVDASIVIRVEPADLETLAPTQTPGPTASAGPISSCEVYNTINAGLPVPRFIDETGLVTSCTSTDSSYSPLSPVIVLQNVDDPIDRVLEISWVGSSCDGDSTVTFARATDRFTVTIDRGAASGCDSVALRWIRLNLSEPVDAGAIDLNDTAH